MSHSNLLEHFSLNIASFQEGFNSLLTSTSLKDFANKYAQLIKRNLLVSGVSVFYRSSNSDEWQSLFSNHSKTIENKVTHHSKEEFSISYDYPESNHIFVILPNGTGSIFHILIGHKLDNSGFSDLDKLTLQFLINLLNNAYQAFDQHRREKDLIFSLNSRVLQINSLIDTGIEIASMAKQNAVLEFNALHDSGSDDAQIDNQISLFELSLQSVASLTNASKAHLRITAEETVNDIYFPGEFNNEEPSLEESRITHSFDYQDKTYCFTLFEKESRSGVVSFDDTDSMILEGIVRQVNAALENDYLLKQLLEKQKIEQEIAVAGAIQQAIIPKELHKIPGYDLFGINIPSKDVGGDYYDCIHLQDGRFALVIADVSGKGVPASLLVSSLQASLYAYLEGNLSLPKLAHKLNHAIFNASTIDKYITFFIAVLSPGQGKLEVLNAGHNPALLLKSDNSLHKLKAGGICIGMFDSGIEYTTESITIEPGESLLLFTDGIPEATVDEENFYEDETLEEYVVNNAHKNADLFIHDLMNDVREFVGGQPKSDDITALFLKRNK